MALKKPHPEVLPSLQRKLAEGRVSRREFLTLLGISSTALGSITLFGCGTPSSEYDYIIIGAGSAGCTLAARLMADSQARVLLVEAGGSNDRPEVRDFSQSWKLTQPDSGVDWGFKSEPQPSLMNKPQSYSMGKLLGGSSSINGMVWVRGNQADYDGWAAAGCTGWDFQRVLPSLKALETFTSGDPAFHGTSGPIRPSTALTSQSALAQAIVRAAQGQGYPLNQDFNGASQPGVGYTQLNVVNGIRQDAFTSFVVPYLQQDKRLTVMTGARVKRITLDGSRRVDQVILDQEGKELAVRANKEVIVCAGTVLTPQLLMLSGVGDPEQLQPLGLPVMSKLPGVGRNLHDHLVTVAVRKLRNPEPASHTTVMDVNVFAGQGPRTGQPRFEIQSYYMRYGWGSYPSEALAFGAIHLHPTSRGTVKLRSADFKDAPVIDPNFLGTPEDLTHQLEGYKLIRQLLAAPELRDWVEDVEHTPGPNVTTDEQLTAALRQYSESDFHPVGTCRMGTDDLAVVDPELRVRGVSGLRVACAAIMPSVTSGNTNAPAMMIGDRCGRLLLDKA